MAESRHLQILVTAKNQAQKQLQGFQGQVEKLQPAFQKMAMAGTAATGAISYGIKQAVDAAGSAQDIDNLFSEAFQSTEGDMRKFVDDFSQEFGRARTNVKKQAADIGFAISMGTDMAEEQMAKVTKESVEVSEALALTYDRVKSGDQAMQALAKAHNGENQALKELIPTISERNIEEKAVAMGLAKTREEVDETARAEALHQLVMEGTVKSRKLLGEAEGTYTDTVMRARAAVQQASETLGKQFLPMITEALVKITPIIKAVGEWARENKTLVKNIVIATAAIAALTATFGTLGMAIVPVIKTFKSLSKLFFFIKAHPVTLLVTALGVLAYAIYKIYQDWDEVKPYLILVWEQVKAGVTKAVSGTAEAMKYWFDVGINKVKDKLNSFLDGVNKWITKVPFIDGEPIEFRFETADAERHLDNLNGITDNHAKTLEQVENKYHSAIQGTDRGKDSMEELKGMMDQASGSSEKNMDKMGELGKKTEGSGNKVSEAAKKMREAMQDFNQKTKKAITESVSKIRELRQELEGARTTKAKDELSARQDIAKEYVNQEERVQDLEKQVREASDKEEREKLQNKLEKEREILRKHGTIEMAYENEVQNERDERRKSDLEKAVDQFEQKIHLAQKEYEQEAKKIQKEIMLEAEKLSVYKKIQEREQQIRDKFRAKNEKENVESINRQIEKYNSLAEAISKAQSGQTSAALGISRSTRERASQKVNPVNITVNGDVSGEELIEKVKGGIMGELGMNGKFAFD